MRFGRSRVSGSPSWMYPSTWPKLGFTRKPLLLRSSIFTLQADVQRPVSVGAAFAGPLHALRVCDGVPVQRQLPGGAAGELVELEGRVPRLTPLPFQVALLLIRQLVVEGQADVQRVLLSLGQP